MRTLVDASVWTAYFNGARSPLVDWLDASLGRAALVVADLTLVEVLRGIADEAEQERARAALLKFSIVETAGRDLALQAADYLRALRTAAALEPPLPQALIATACLAGGLQLLHQDPAYEPFEQHLGLATPGAVVEVW
ncbi:MAG TPA: PIN domain-containing protein [Thermoanaerobaculia bacterium]|nr:PIN domain-containing protein [Thermoanaerobaculia bacterium]